MRLSTFALVVFLVSLPCHILAQSSEDVIRVHYSQQMKNGAAPVDSALDLFLVVEAEQIIEHGSFKFSIELLNKSEDAYRRYLLSTKLTFFLLDPDMGHFRGGHPDLSVCCPPDPWKDLRGPVPVAMTCDGVSHDMDEFLYSYAAIEGGSRCRIVYEVRDLPKRRYRGPARDDLPDMGPRPIFPGRYGLKGMFLLESEVRQVYIWSYATSDEDMSFYSAKDMIFFDVLEALE